jgi:hypothetical protein
MRDADGSIQHAQVVVNFRDGPNGGARTAVGGLLLDGNGGAEAIDGIDVGPFHLVQKLPGIGGKRLHVAPLPFGVNGIESQR